MDIKNEFNHIDGHDCLDDALYTLFNNKGLKYYYAFLGSWRFKYNNKKSIGEGIVTGRENRFAILKKIYNIKYEVIDIKNPYDQYPLPDFADIYLTEYNKKIIFNRLKEVLNNGNSVILEFDSYYCHWDKLYKKIHGTHMCVINKIVGENIEIIDSWYSLKIVIDIEMFFKFMYKCIIINWDNLILQDISIEEQLDMLIPNEFRIKKDLENFISDFKEIDLDKEFYMCTEKDYSKQPIIRKIKEISNNRKQIAIALKEFDISDEIINEFESLSLNWQALLNLVLKMFLTRSKNIIKEEEKLLDDLYEREINLISVVKEYKNDKINCI